MTAVPADNNPQEKAGQEALHPRYEWRLQELMAVRKNWYSSVPDRTGSPPLSTGDGRTLQCEVDPMDGTEPTVLNYAQAPTRKVTAANGIDYACRTRVGVDAPVGHQVQLRIEQLSVKPLQRQSLSPRLRMTSSTASALCITHAP
ncbi:hypothetical protein ACFV7R_30945 [Streptomyces sp. NPDC059866]|uniref:hypothetical protein n=1 Tax=Streptomyces sp. NPDC059866 TaxID=3346978 RepID=UPI00365D727A